MNRLLVPALAALAVGLSACTANPPAAPPAPTYSEGTPFLPVWIENIQNPPTSVPDYPETLEDLLLPPTAKENK